MQDRKVILFSSEAVEPLIEFIRITVNNGNQSKLIRLGAVRDLTDSIYDHIDNNPLVILIVANEEELSDLTMITSLLQRVDLILFLAPNKPGMKKRSYSLRPRLIFDNDDDLEKAGLLIKGILAKKKTNDYMPDGPYAISMDAPGCYISFCETTNE